MRILLMDFDLMFSSKIKSIAVPNDCEVRKVRDFSEANLVMEQDLSALLLIQLGKQSPSEISKLSYPDRTIGVYSHVDNDSAKIGEELGLASLWTRSVVEKKLRSLVSSQNKS